MDEPCWSGAYRVENNLFEVYAIVLPPFSVDSDHASRSQGVDDWSTRQLRYDRVGSSGDIYGCKWLIINGHANGSQWRCCMFSQNQRKRLEILHM